MNKAKILTAYLAERQPAPFSWQAANCAHFAGRYVELVEGCNPLSGIAMPATQAAARRAVRKAGGLQAWVCAALGRDAIPPLLAQVGDVVLLPLSEAGPQAEALGLCCGEHAVFVMTGGAVGFVPMAAVTAAWRVGA